MQIFNVILNGEDIVWFCSLRQEDKINWIKENTNQKSDILIEEFLANKPIVENSKGYCVPCRGKKTKATISEVIKKK